MYNAGHRPDLRALIFDFDGLILDTETTDYESWRRVYAEYGVELPRNAWVDTIGTDGKAFDPVECLCELTGRALTEAEVRGRHRPLRDALVRALEPLPGVENWLLAARTLGLRLAVASSSPRPWVEGHLDHVGLLKYFEALITREQVARAKPHPDLYQRAVEGFGLAPEAALALEDSPNGLAAARAAGLRSVAVPGPMTQHLDFSAADLVLDSLAAQSLEQVLEQLGDGA